MKCVQDCTINFVYIQTLKFIGYELSLCTSVTVPKIRERDLDLRICCIELRVDKVLPFINTIAAVSIGFMFVSDIAFVIKSNRQRGGIECSAVIRWQYSVAVRSAAVGCDRRKMRLDISNDRCLKIWLVALQPGYL